MELIRIAPVSLESIVLRGLALNPDASGVRSRGGSLLEGAV